MMLMELGRQVHDWLATPADKTWVEIWKHWARPSGVIMREEQVRQSFSYAWLAGQDLTACRSRYNVPLFLPSLLQHVYRRILMAGQFVPFPVVIYLAVGYTLGEVHSTAPKREDQRDRVAADVANNFTAELNRWL